MCFWLMYDDVGWLAGWLAGLLVCFPKYRYLHCSRTLGSPSIAIYSVPALAQVTQDR